ncbi:hypothetical protein PUR71_00700 [Streptomyces sp. SP17BM10]|uniref:DUF6879 family protein n=1 Tax=Streptomyces sp. SP17BM10 TaxID=3002530 RepID=UPI002E76A39B|nr:DUF6879 family protein [Streptomyces sp. SP17BM10]MEE1781467.1 hypothetical protein [Streptomyces sp. SP17BM10]
MSLAPFDQLFASCERSAVHLEMRDAYMLDDPMFLAWKAGDVEASGRAESPWLALMASTTGRGVEVRRARIVSEPVSEYVRFEYDITDLHNIAVGEQVRWLPRRRTTDLALPGNDFWLFDSRTVLINHFTGQGDFVDHEVTEDPDVARLCATAFEAVWARATSHEAYEPA